MGGRSGNLGAVALGAVGAWIGCRRTGLSFASFADALAPGLLLAQAIGRLGNWFNQELFGAPTTMPWGLEIDAAHIPAGYDPGTLFHPTFLYELLWCTRGDHYPSARPTCEICAVPSLLALCRVVHRRSPVDRALRIDTAEIIFGMRVNVWVSILVMVGGTIGFFLAGRGNKYVNDSMGNQPQVDAEITE